MICKFETIGEDTHKCSVCGYTIHAKQKPEKVRRVCSKREGLLNKAVGFVSTVTEWVSSGAPVTEKVDVEKRLKICQECENYDGSSCKLCSCYMQFKARMETAQCPIGKW